MEGLEFLFSLIGLGMLVHWLLVHDKKSDKPTRGLFAMHEPDSGAGEPQPTRRLSR